MGGEGGPGLSIKGTGSLIGAGKGAGSGVVRSWYSCFAFFFFLATPGVKRNPQLGYITGDSTIWKEILFGRFKGMMGR